MRHYVNIAVTDAIVHVVAPQRDQLHRSTSVIKVSDAVQTFLVEHVAKGLADGNARAARFRVLGPERPEGLCRSIVRSADQFVERSGALAGCLFSASTGQASVDARISDSALAVARCQADDGAERVSFLAVLKLDPNDAFRAEITTSRDGKEVVELILQPGTLPSPRERLQKAAFVRTQGSDFDALVVDKQRRGSVVSAYFIDGFLGLEEVSDATTRTRDLYRTFSRVIDEVRPDLTSQEARQLDDYLRGAMMGQHIDADALVEAAPGPDLVRERLAARVEDELPDRNFDTDPDVAARLVRRQVFRAANHLTVAGPATAFQDMVTVTPPQQTDGDYVITIRTSQWSGA